MPKFDEISQSTAEIKLLPVWKTDGRHIKIISGCDFDLCVVIGRVVNFPEI